jgi:2-oxoglutarate dehydrogenase E1 component
MHIQNTEEQRWIQEQLEGVHVEFSKAEKHRILESLNSAESFEKFLATKYVGTKRFGLEGAESAITILDEVLSQAADAGVQAAVLGMAHRGRLNVLANIMGKSFDQIFKEFEGHLDPSSVQGSGDVKYHLGAAGTYESAAGNTIDIELAANPSHLETVDPIVMGMVRAMQDQIDPPGSFPALALLIHGDAAFAGQGIVAECLAMSDISGYRVGGTVHLIINNQIGFTTSPQHSRSSLYCSDVAKTVQAPIFHVNGDDPEACARVARLAFEYRRRFHKDVVIDMVCYRRHGHNEGDDPSYTQPLMYRAIAERRSVRKVYVESLVKRGDISLEEAERALDDFQSKLQAALDDTRAHAPGVIKAARPPQPRGVLPHIETGVDRSVLDSIFTSLTAYPDGFTPHPKLLRQFAARAKQYDETGLIDWATAEAMAIGSLVLDGVPVRLAGEDSRRGTFSHRHAALIDYETEDVFIPLASLPGSKAQFWVYDSLLSEYAALGYEYGYAHTNPEALVLWEAQFGDFVNGAQVIIDQFISSGELKWLRMSGLVMLLPHGYEGQGPEHSSARPERFLQLCAEDNWQVANVTTPANYFHILRRQIRRNFRKPLIMLTPKSLLRHKGCVSTLDYFLTGSSFHRVLWDESAKVTGDKVKRVVLCTGKVYFDLAAEAQARNLQDVAVIRVEQLYPFPRMALGEELKKYPNAEVVWCQEEPANMGYWFFVDRRIEKVLTEIGHKAGRPSYAGRAESASPATGLLRVHNQEQARLVDEALTVK